MMNETVAREAMAKALYESSPDRTISWEDWLYKHWHLEHVDAVLAADPLRRLLGTKAVEALLAGEAAVVRIHAVDGEPPHMAYRFTDEEGRRCTKFLPIERLDHSVEAA